DDRVFTDPDLIQPGWNLNVPKHQVDRSPSANGGTRLEERESGLETSPHEAQSPQRNQQSGEYNTELAEGDTKDSKSEGASPVATDGDADTDATEFLSPSW